MTIIPVKTDILNIPSDFRNLLLTLENHGFKGAFLYGGALRDVALGRPDKINDLDISMSFPPSLNTVKFHHFNRDIYAQKTIEALRNIPALENIHLHRHVIKYKKIPAQSHNRKNGKNKKKRQRVLIALRIDCYMGDNLVSFFIEPEKSIAKRLEQKFINYDAPINYVYMTHDGVVKAHPNFKYHIKKRIFAANPHHRNPEYVLQRYIKLSHKIKGLQYQSGHENHGKNKSYQP